MLTIFIPAHYVGREGHVGRASIVTTNTSRIWEARDEEVVRYFRLAMSRVHNPAPPWQAPIGKGRAMRAPAGAGRARGALRNTGG